MQPSRKFAQVGLFATVVILGMSMVTLVLAREADAPEPAVTQPAPSLNADTPAETTPVIPASAEATVRTPSQQS
ncbi:MAG: hypothetical protein ACFCVE_04040 [Phycisphaerae bacterium]